MLQFWNFATFSIILFKTTWQIFGTISRDLQYFLVISQNHLKFFTYFPHKLEFWKMTIIPGIIVLKTSNFYQTLIRLFSI